MGKRNMEQLHAWSREGQLSLQITCQNMITGHACMQLALAAKIVTCMCTSKAACSYWRIYRFELMYIS